MSLQRPLKVLSLCFICLFAVLISLVSPYIQQLLTVANGFASKTICTGVFLSQRDITTIQSNELEGLSSLLTSSVVNYEEKSVTSTLFGCGESLSRLLRLPVSKSIYIGEKYGCQLQLESYTSRHPLRDLAPPNVKYSDATLTPSKHTDIDISCLQSFVDAEFTPVALKQNQSRAIVVSHKGEVVAEGYQGLLGVTPDMKLLGWSMTKSVFSMVIGAGVQAGLLSLDTPLKLSGLSASHKAELIKRNGGREITFRQALQMEDILAGEENYGIMADVVRMLYGSPDTAALATSLAARPIPQSPTTRSKFDWYYSSGVSNLLSNEFRALFSSDDEYWAFPHTHLFGPINASVTIEMDPSGNYVASSFGYASGRDWAKLGDLLLSNGTFNGKQIISAEYVQFMQEPHPASGGHYGGHIWLNAARVSVRDYNLLPLHHIRKKQCYWITRSLPSDAFYMGGHDAQFVFIVPSMNLVVVRIGYTHDSPDGYIGWDTERFFSTLVNSCKA